MKKTLRAVGISALFALYIPSQALAEDAPETAYRENAMGDGWLWISGSKNFSYYIKKYSLFYKKVDGYKPAFGLIRRSVGIMAKDRYTDKVYVTVEDCANEYGVLYADDLANEADHQKSPFAFGDNTMGSTVAEAICKVSSRLSTKGLKEGPLSY